ncbi:MAG: hypothetical protein HY271_09850 [Deltaproteobacteria bacterium]|nr:hypothetical protein [Deltaproteobacteria bacterium]
MDAGHGWLQCIDALVPQSAGKRATYDPETPETEETLRFSVEARFHVWSVGWRIGLPEEEVEAMVNAALDCVRKGAARYRRRGNTNGLFG